MKKFINLIPVICLTAWLGCGGGGGDTKSKGVIAYSPLTLSNPFFKVIGDHIKEVLECDLKAEYSARALYKEAREVCNEEGDYVTMRLFEQLMEDEEGHIDFIETELELLEKIGVEKYGQLQASPASEAE